MHGPDQGAQDDHHDGHRRRKEQVPGHGADGMHVKTGPRYPPDLAPRLADAGGRQWSTASQPGRHGRGEPAQAAAVPVPPPAQRRPGPMSGDHRQGDEVDVADDRQAYAIGRPAAHRRRVQRAQQQQRGQHHDQYLGRIEPDFLSEPRHARQQREHQPRQQACPGSGQPAPGQRHARRRGRHGQHRQQAHRQDRIAERRDPAMQHQVVSKLGGIGPGRARDQLMHRIGGERPAPQLIPPQPRAAELIAANKQCQQRGPQPWHPHGPAGQTVKRRAPRRGAGPAGLGPCRTIPFLHIPRSGHQAPPCRLRTQPVRALPTRSPMLPADVSARGAALGPGPFILVS
jgi:hypothetical protein